MIAGRPHHFVITALVALGALACGAPARAVTVMPPASATPAPTTVPAMGDSGSFVLLGPVFGAIDEQLAAADPWVPDVTFAVGASECCQRLRRAMRLRSRRARPRRAPRRRPPRRKSRPSPPSPSRCPSSLSARRSTPASRRWCATRSATSSTCRRATPRCGWPSAAASQSPSRRSTTRSTIGCKARAGARSTRRASTWGTDGCRFGAAIGIWAIGREVDKRGRAAHLGLDLLRAQIVTQTLTYALKVATQRERPDGSGNDSFPSGHASTTWATATVLERHIGWKAAAADLSPGHVRRYLAAPRESAPPERRRVRRHGRSRGRAHGHASRPPQLRADPNHGSARRRGIGLARVAD